MTKKLSIERYGKQKANCDNLCDIDDGRISKDDDSVMPCVTCPFCKKIVNAILTPETISCPSCKITVKRQNRLMDKDDSVYKELVDSRSPEFFCDTCGHYPIEPMHGHFVCPECKSPTKCCEGLPADV